MNKQEILLSYGLRPNKEKPEELILLSLGSPENFYEALKRQICRSKFSKIALGKLY
jgi:hypothetical protein